MQCHAIYSAGKDVTVVKGLDVFGLDMKSVTNALKKRFSCSVSVYESIPGAADGARYETQRPCA